MSILTKIFIDYNPVVYLTQKIFTKSDLLADLSDYGSDLLCQAQSLKLKQYLFWLGVGALSYKVYNFMHVFMKNWAWAPIHFHKHKALNESNIKQRYGNCYALITGFTEGIGLGFSQMLAELGFNLILVSRNKDKVNRKSKELLERFPKIKIQTIVCNMANKNQIADLQRVLSKTAEELDIGIIINNAGSVAGGPYIEINPHHIVDDCNVDLVALYAVNKILIPKMRLRQKRSAIVNVSSCTGVFLSGRLGVYSSTKRSLDIYSQILDLEHRDKIDIISLRPFGVTTKMMKMKKGPLMITPRECAKSALIEMVDGHITSFGHSKHKLSRTAFEWLSEQHRFELYDKLWAQARQQAGG